MRVERRSTRRELRELGRCDRAVPRRELPARYRSEDDEDHAARFRRRGLRRLRRRRDDARFTEDDTCTLGARLRDELDTCDRADVTERQRDRTPSRRIRRSSEMEASDDARLRTIDEDAHLGFRLSTCGDADRAFEARTVWNERGTTREAWRAKRHTAARRSRDSDRRDHVTAC